MVQPILLKHTVGITTRKIRNLIRSRIVWIARYVGDRVTFDVAIWRIIRVLSVTILKFVYDTRIRQPDRWRRLKIHRPRTEDLFENFL